MATSLTREQKLLAEIVVQLGNVVEAIQSAASGEDSSDLNNKIDALQSQLAAVSSARAALQQQLAEATTLNAELQTQLATIHEGDITPDNINEVMTTLGINTTHEPLRQIDGAKAQVDTSEAYCWYLQGRQRGCNRPCSCLATYGTTCGRFY